MKFFVTILLTALLGHAAPLFFPWWSFAVTSFIVAIFIHQKPGKALVSGFFGIFLLFTIHAFVLDYLNDHILAKKVAEIFQLGKSSLAVIFISAFSAALVSGLSALSGSLMRGKSN